MNSLTLKQLAVEAQGNYQFRSKHILVSSDLDIVGWVAGNKLVSIFLFGHAMDPNPAIHPLIIKSSLQVKVFFHG